MFYSASTGGFYTTEIHGNNMPADVVPLTVEEHADLLAAQAAGKIIQPGANGKPVAVEPPVSYKSSLELKAEIDAMVASIYSNWTRFEAEYREREAAAQAFADGGYAGDPGIWVTAFSDAAGVSLQDAADLILIQAGNLRAAKVQLGALRMRKYELDGLEGAAAEAKADEITTAIQAVAATIS